MNSLSPKIVYDDKDFVVLDKPAGLLTHGTGRGERGTLVDFVLERWPDIKSVGDPSTISGQGLRPGIVHRLDRDTSGLIVVAKNRETFEYLKRGFQERQITKRYLALVHGAMPTKNGEIILPIGYGAHGAVKRAAGLNKRLRGERAALTIWRLQKQYPNFTLLEVEPKTGRTHQIRVHLAAIGHPVAGDPLYGHRKSIDPLRFARQFLHASYLAFSLPNGRRFVFESDVPADLQGILKILGS